MSLTHISAHIPGNPLEDLSAPDGPTFCDPGAHNARNRQNSDASLNKNPTKTNAAIWVIRRQTLDENRRIRVVYSRTHARKFQIYGHFQVCATRTLGVCGPAHGPDMNHSAQLKQTVRLVLLCLALTQLVTGADISLVWAPVVRSRPKLFIPRCATSLAEAVTHGPNILCHSTALSRDTAYSPEGCTSVLWSGLILSCTRTITRLCPQPGSQDPGYRLSKERGIL
ncbi:hypothetical protein Bbelb_028570 [Branchiostoma belcheri]|nr:hypothetical protein Bbelb_028570 [Branchiostoma belcheri]